MTTIQIFSPKQDKKAPKKRQQSFRKFNIDTARVPLSKSQNIKQEPELLSDWEDAS